MLKKVITWFTCYDAQQCTDRNKNIDDYIAKLEKQIAKLEKPPAADMAALADRLKDVRITYVEHLPPSAREIMREVEDALRTPRALPSGRAQPVDKGE